MVHSFQLNFAYNPPKKYKGSCLDGRDITYKIVPDADLKLFLTASDSVRAKRRFEEMVKNGLEVSYEDILYNIKNRDLLDSTRTDSPLVIEKDAVVIDNSHMSINDQIVKISKLIEGEIYGSLTSDEILDNKVKNSKLVKDLEEYISNFEIKNKTSISSSDRS